MIVRVFRLKCKELIKDIVDNQIFGKVASYFNSIEFQKRGLPHMHLFLILHAEYKILTLDQIDRVVCAEIPNPIRYPKLFALVERHMIHGPCGVLNSHSPCMAPAKKCAASSVCLKHFPKEYYDETTYANNGYSIYRRRNTGTTVKKGQYSLDNRWVVPYNRYLLLKYNGHINVEICSSLMSVKYLYKYILKGNDTATFQIVTSAHGDKSHIVYDEISQFINTRCVTPPEGLSLSKFEN